MGTVTKSWTFTSDAEGFTDVGDSAITFQKDPGDASVHFAGAASGTQERGRGPTGETWETWGVPAGATVTDVQITAWSYRRWSSTQAGSLALRVVDSGGTTVHSAGELATATLATGQDGSWQAQGAGTSRAVDSGKQASTTEIRLEIQYNCSSPSTVNDIGIDTITIEVTYSGGPTPPSDTGRATTQITSASDPWTVNLPTHGAGDLLILYARAAGNTTFNTPTDWIPLISNDTSDASDDRTGLFCRKVTGSLGATMSLDLSGTQKGSAIVWCISDAADPATLPPEISTVVVSAAANVNPGSVTPTGGPKAFLYLVLGGCDGETQTFANAALSNVTNANSGTAGSVATNCRIAGGTIVQTNSSSYDPAAWTVAAPSAGASAWTIAIHPVPPSGSSTPIGISAGVTLSPSISTQVIRARSLAPGLTVSPSVSRQRFASRTLSVTVVATPSVARMKSAPRALSVGVTLTPSISRVRSFLKSISAGVTFTPLIDTLRQGTRQLVVTVTITPSFARKFIYSRLLSVTLTVAPSILRRLPQSLVAGLTLIASLTRLRRYLKNFSVPVTLAPISSRRVPKSLAVAVPMNPSIDARRGSSISLPVTATFGVSMGRLQQKGRLLIVSLPMNPSISRKATLSQLLSAGLILTPSISQKKTVGRQLSASAVLVPSIGDVALHRVSLLTGAVLSPTMTKGYSRSLSVPLTLTAALSQAQRYSKSLPVNLVLTPSMVQLGQSGKLLQADLVLVPSIDPEFTKARFLEVSLVLVPTLSLFTTAEEAVFVEGMLMSASLEPTAVLVATLGADLVSVVEVQEIVSAVDSKQEAVLVGAEAEKPMLQ